MISKTRNEQGAGLYRMLEVVVVQAHHDKQT